MSRSKILVALLGVTAMIATGGGAKAAGRSPGGRAQASPQKAQLIEISVTSDGFVPAAVKVKAGQPVRMIITRKTERTCATNIVIKDFQINKPLPLHQAVEIGFTPTHPGTIRYACAMNMISGTLTVQ